jgi:small subunit ribosomal protein S16
VVKLRLTRLGRKKVPVYRIVAMEALSKRDGKAIAYLGTYNPLTEPAQVTLKEEEIIKFLMNGAQPTLTVKALLKKAGVIDKFEAAKKANKEAK